MKKGNNLTLVVNNEESLDMNTQGSFERLQALVALKGVLIQNPILQKEYSLDHVENKIAVAKEKMIEQQKNQDKHLIPMVKEKYQHLIEKRELQNEVVDFCKSIKNAVVCEKEINFEIRFHHHVLFGVLAMYRLNQNCVMGVFTGATSEGTKCSSIVYTGEMLDQYEIDANEQLRKEIAHGVLSENSSVLSEFHKEFLCREFNIVYGLNNVVEFNSSLAKVLSFKQADNETGPFAG